MYAAWSFASRNMGLCVPLRCVMLSPTVSRRTQKQVSLALNADEAGIFDAHLLVLEDPMLIESVNSAVSSKKINIEAAFKEFADKYTASLSAIDDAYLRERVADMRDVTSRILSNLMGSGPRHQLAELREPCILICDDLPPSDLAVMNRKAVLGFATAGGGKTSHSAIMARSFPLHRSKALFSRWRNWKKPPSSYC